MQISDIFEYIQELNSLEKNEIVLEFREIINCFRDKKIIWLNDIPDRVREAALIYCDGNMEQAMEELSEIVMDFNQNPKDYIINMELTLENYCTYEDICPVCGQELIYNSWQEDRPYGDGYCSEDMSELICVNRCVL